jgi:hypothetical protein
MSKRLGILLGIGLFPLLAYAQWNEKDALNLNRILHTNGEIKLPDPYIMMDEKPALSINVTLPKVFPEKRDVRLSLRPYTASTKYNYDPIYQKKINIKSDTWKYGEKFHLHIAASSLGPASGSGISGDFMAIFTKDFWDRNGRKRRARTLEILQNYGDSITVLINEEIKKPVVR